MPEPIRTLREQGSQSDFFTTQGTSSMPVSDMMSSLLGIEKTAAKVTFSDHVVDLLEQIAKNEDELLTATDAIVQKTASVNELEMVYKVPRNISDHDLLALKTQGLVLGNGRAVKLTDLGRIALRDRWLRSANLLLKNRKKSKFVHRLAGSESPVTNKEAKFARTSEDGMEELPQSNLDRLINESRKQVALDTCGFCNQNGAKVRPTNQVDRLPNTVDPGTPFVHPECEAGDDERAMAEIEQRLGPEGLRNILIAKKRKLHRVEG